MMGSKHAEKDEQNPTNYAMSVDAIVVAMDNNLKNAKFISHCCSELSKLTLKSRHYAKDIISKRALELITQGMALSPMDIGLQAQGCITIWALLVDKENCLAEEEYFSAVIKSGGCGAVVAAIQRHKEVPSVVEPAFGAIKCLSANIDCKSELETKQARLAVVEAMDACKKDGQLQAKGCSVLNNLAVDIMSNSVAIMSHGEVDAIVRSMADHPDDVLVQLKACFVLKNLSLSMQNCVILKKNEGMLCKLLSCAAWRFPKECKKNAERVVQCFGKCHQSNTDSKLEKDEGADHKLSLADALVHSAMEAGKQCDYNLAQSQLEKALELKHSFSAAGDLVYLLKCIGYVMAIQSNFVGAVKKYEESLEIQQSQSLSNAADNKSLQIDMADTLTSLGVLYMKVHDYDKAEMFLKKAINLKNNVHVALSGNFPAAKDLENLGDISCHRGHLADAERLYITAASKYSEAEAAKFKLDMASVMSKLGMLACARGDNELAQDHLKLAIEMKRSVYGSKASNMDLAETFSSLGYVYAVSGHSAEAIEQYEESLDMQYQICGGAMGNDCLAQTLTSLSVLYTKSGQTSSAKISFEEALDTKQSLEVCGMNKSQKIL